MKFEHTFTSLGVENEYPKLVRDRIPEIIENEDGRVADVRELDFAEFELYLRQKAVEEASELAAAENDSNLAEEIADVLEILDELDALKEFDTKQSLTSSNSATQQEHELRQEAIEVATKIVSANTDSELQATVASLRGVLRNLMRLKKFKPEDIIAVQNEKREKRGGFTKRIIMLSND